MNITIEKTRTGYRIYDDNREHDTTYVMFTRAGAIRRYRRENNLTGKHITVTEI